MSENNPNSNPNRFHRRRRPLWGIALLVGVIALAGGWAMGSRLGSRRFPSRLQAASVEDLQANLTRITRWSLRRVGATEDQKQEIQTIVAGLAPDLFEMQSERERLHGRLERAVRSGEVDSRELEAVRAESIRLADRASARTVEALTQALAVLTPEQRQQLLKQMGERQWLD